MIDDARRIFDYLPLVYKTQIESEYIDFLWDAFEVNYEKGKYQFAYIAYHMLFMCFVYFQLAKIYLNKSEEIKNMMVFTGKVMEQVEKYEAKVTEALATKNNPPHFDPFSLALENERSIIGLFIFIGCDRSVVKKMKEFVDKRNNIAHSNGNISFNNQSIIDEKIEEILDVANSIQQNTREISINCYENFLSSNYDPEYWTIAGTEEDQIREVFVRQNYLCPKDIQFAYQHDITGYSSETYFTDLKKLHLKLQEMYPND